MTMEGDPSYGPQGPPNYGYPVYPYPQNGPTAAPAEQDTAPGGPIYDALRAVGVPEDDLAEMDYLDMLDLYASYQDVGLIPKGTSSGSGGGAPSAANLTAQALLNPELIDLTSQGLPGRAILRGTDQIIDLRQPGQFKPIAGMSNVYYDAVTGEVIDREGNVIRREELALATKQHELDTELGRGNLAVSEGNLAVNQGRLGLEDQAQGFRQQYEFPEEQRQFNASLTGEYDLAGDTNRRLAASDILSNAVTLQGQQDERGFAAIRSAADPGNFVEREYISRGLAAPQQGQVSAFQTVPQVQQGFDALGNYRPTAAPPLSAVAPGTKLPVSSLLGGGGYPYIKPLPDKPLATKPLPNLSGVQLNAPPSQVYTSTDPNSPFADPWSQATMDEYQNDLATGSVALADPNLTPTNYDYGASNPLDATDQYNFEIRDGNLVAVPQYAGGTRGYTTASKMIVGDPQASGRPNPELVEVPPGTPTRVTPLNHMPASQALAHANPNARFNRTPTAPPREYGPYPATISPYVPRDSIYNPNPGGSGVPAYADGTEEADAAPRGAPLDLPTVSVLLRAAFAMPPDNIQFDDQYVDTTMVEDRREQEPTTMPANPDLWWQYNPRAKFPKGPPAYANGTGDHYPHEEYPYYKGPGTVRRGLPSDIPTFAYGTEGMSGEYQITDPAELEHLKSLIPEYKNSYFGSASNVLGAGSAPISTQPQGTVSQANPNPMLPINSDESIQNLPTLDYLRGTMDEGTYGTLNTGNVQGAFGTQLPEAGGLNFSKIMRIAQDPVALKMLDSLYRSASRSLSAEVERAKARAPIGNAPVSSLVRT